MKLSWSEQPGFLDLELMVLLAAFLSAGLIGLSELSGALRLERIPLGFYLLFFPSGFLFMRLLFPAEKISLEKIALSIASSLALTGLLTLITNVFFGLRLSVLLFLCLVVFPSTLFYALFKFKQFKGVEEVD